MQLFDIAITTIILFGAMNLTLTMIAFKYYANDQDTRRSTTGYCIFYGSCLISWASQRQRIVSLSSSKSEYISACELCKEIIPISSTFEELGYKDVEPVDVYIDNQSTVKMAKKTAHCQRTKHMDVRDKWISERVEENKIRVNHIPGTDQVADILTKPLTFSKFEKNRSRLMALVSLVILCMLVWETEAYSFVATSMVYYNIVRKVREHLNTRSLHKRIDSWKVRCTSKERQ